jgi:uncharacterized membrane protein YbaN (DUF454 family)
VRLTRPLYVALGFLSVGVGAVGVVVPVLPTTVFLLIAAWCFTKASPRMEAWLRGHRVFGRYLSDWEQGRSIPRSAKVAAGLGMLSSVLIAGVVFEVSALPLTLMALTLAAVFAWIVRRPEPARGRTAERAEAPGGVALADEPA